MSWRLGNGIILRSQIGFQLWRTLNDIHDVNRASENMKETLNISAEESLGLYEWKQLKPRFGDKCSQYLDQRKQAKMQWVQDSKQSNVDNLNNVRREASKRCRYKRRNI